MTAEAIHSVAAVVKLTGLSPNTLRTWERRYRAVHPRRDGAGHRVYTTEDVERLRLLKQLSASGESVRRLTGVTLEDLRARAEVHRDASSGVLPLVRRRRRAPRIALLHGSLLEVFAATAQRVPWVIVFEASALPSFIAKFPRREAPVDVLLVDVALLGADPVESLERARKRCGATHVVVTYDFASSIVCASLRSAGARLIRGPLDPQQLLAEISTEIAKGGEGVNAPAPTPPPRRYSEPALARLRATATLVECECPRNLASLVTQLVAFEDYSASCARNSPADAAMHDTIAIGVALARSALEDLLSALCSYEGLAET